MIFSFVWLKTILWTYEPKQSSSTQTQEGGWRRKEWPVMKAISREAEESSSGTLSTTKAPLAFLLPQNTTTTTSSLFSPWEISLQTKYRVMRSFLFHYRLRVNKRNLPSIWGKECAESHEIPDMNYWRCDGTGGMMCELKPESKLGKDRL